VYFLLVEDPVCSSIPGLRICIPFLLNSDQQFPPMRPMSYVTMMSEESAGDLTSIWL